MKKKSLIVAGIVLLLDQLIKYIINSSFYYGALKSIIPGFFYLTKVYNDGAAWSIMRGGSSILIIIALISFVVLWFYQKKFVVKKRVYVSFGLVYGGLLGNLIDRVRLGEVIDYLKVNIGSYEAPIFNLADVAIVVGFLMIIYAIFKGDEIHGNSGK